MTLKIKKRMALLAALTACIVSVGCCVTGMVSMPGRSFEGTAAPVAGDDAALQERLSEVIEHLSVTIGERNVLRKPDALAEAERFIASELTAMGYVVERQTFDAQRFRDGVSTDAAHAVSNLVAEKKGTGRASEVVVVGAHYDSSIGTPGADDNGSGVAANLALAAAFAKVAPERTVRFVFFVNEEPPWFKGEHMGSEVYAAMCEKRGDDIVAMMALETMAFFRSEPGSQHYPWPLSLLYPSTGTFIAFVGDTASQGLVHDAVRTFRDVATIPSEGAALPADIEGVDWSDHGPFWRHGYRAFMVTDTAPFRNPHYHQQTDVPATVDALALARTVIGLRHMLEHLTTTTDRW